MQIDKSWDKGTPTRCYRGFFALWVLGFAFSDDNSGQPPQICNSNLFLTKNITPFFHMQLHKDPDSNAWETSHQQLITKHTFTKSAVTIASSVWDPGSHTALMMKLPVASWGWSTKWSETDPELLNVNTWQSWSNEKIWLHTRTKCYEHLKPRMGL